MPPALPLRSRLRRSFDRAASGYDAVASVPREIAARMIERLALVRIPIRMIVDAGSGTGYAANQSCLRESFRVIMKTAQSTGFPVKTNAILDHRLADTVSLEFFHTVRSRKKTAEVLQRFNFYTQNILNFSAVENHSDPRKLAYNLCQFNDPEWLRENTHIA